MKYRSSYSRKRAAMKLARALQRGKRKQNMHTVFNKVKKVNAKRKENSNNNCAMLKTHKGLPAQGPN